jgi:hypothetical protein
MASRTTTTVGIDMVTTAVVTTITRITQGGAA